MNNAFSAVVSILVAAIIFTFLPLMLIYERMDSVRQMYALTETEYFVDSICNTGFLSEDMYKQFIKSLGDKGGVYKVEITQEVNTYIPADDGYDRCKEYYDEEDMIAVFENNENYYFSRDDYIRVIVTRLSSVNPFTRANEPMTECYYGGQIKYEAY